MEDPFQLPRIYSDTNKAGARREVIDFKRKEVQAKRERKRFAQISANFNKLSNNIISKIGLNQDELAELLSKDFEEYVIYMFRGDLLSNGIGLDSYNISIRIGELLRKENITKETIDSIKPIVIKAATYLAIGDFSNESYTDLQDKLKQLLSFDYILGTQMLFWLEIKKVAWDRVRNLSDEESSIDTYESDLLVFTKETQETFIDEAIRVINDNQVNKDNFEEKLELLEELVNLTFEENDTLEKVCEYLYKSLGVEEDEFESEHMIEENQDLNTNLSDMLSTIIYSIKNTADLEDFNLVYDYLFQLTRELGDEFNDSLRIIALHIETRREILERFKTNK